MLKIVLLLLVVIGMVLLVPRLLSHGTLPEVGSAAPDFTLPTQEGSTASLKDYRGKWVVLYFYPKDQTPGCTREAHNFQVDQPKFAERNAVVLGVSLDSVGDHAPTLFETPGIAVRDGGKGRADQHNDLAGLAQGLLDHMAMAEMEGLEPADEDQEIIGGGA
jgi:hypothetical protein